MRKRWLLAALLGLGCGAMGGALAAGDPVAGKIKAETCMGCHGIAGYTNAYPVYRVPKLGGQHVEYVIAALQAYQSGERKHSTMHANAANLSEQDMADIAAFFASFGED